MRNILLALVTICVAEAAASADLSQAPCNLLDNEALSALSLEGASATVDRTTVAATNGHTGGNQTADTCTVTPGENAKSSVVITSAPLSSVNRPKSASSPRAECKSDVILGFSFTICGFAADERINMFSLIEFGPANSTKSATFKAQVERLLESRKAGNG